MYNLKHSLSQTNLSVWNHKSYLLPYSLFNTATKPVEPAMKLSALQRQLATMHIDESVKIEHVLGKHSLDGRDFNVNFVLGIVDNILNLKKVTGEGIEGKLMQLQLNDRELPFQIKRHAFEIASKCLSNEDRHSATIYLLKMLSTYSWEAKLALMHAALAISYGELNLVSLLPSSNNQKSGDDSIKDILDLTKCIVDLNQPSSPPQSLSSTLAIASYWIAGSVLTNATHCAHLHMMGLEFQDELKELYTLTTKIKDILTACSPRLEEKKSQESYEALPHVSNNSTTLKVFKLILNVKDNNEKPTSSSVQLGSAYPKEILVKHSPTIKL